MADTPFDPPAPKDEPGSPVVDFFDAESRVVRDAICPHCGARGSVRVSPFMLNGVRHLHWHCPTCRQVWVERDRRHGQSR